MAQKEKALGRNGAFSIAEVEGTWANRFVQLLCSGCSVDQLEKRFQQLVLMVFNYDRCFEHFIYHSIQNVYGRALGAERAADLVRGLRIYHPYGAVGSLEWMATEEAATPFGAAPGPEKLLQLAGQIKTFTEGTDPNSSEIFELRDSIRKSSRLVFLGFSYADQNLDLLLDQPTSGTERNTYTQCLGTSMGMSDANRAVAMSGLKIRGCKGNIQLGAHDSRCAQFMNDYSGLLRFN